MGTCDHEKLDSNFCPECGESLKRSDAVGLYNHTNRTLNTKIKTLEDLKNYYARNPDSHEKDWQDRKINKLNLVIIKWTKWTELAKGLMDNSKGEP